jgi:hypothetical protein
MRGLKETMILSAALLLVETVVAAADSVVPRRQCTRVLFAWLEMGVGAAQRAARSRLMRWTVWYSNCMSEGANGRQIVALCVAVCGLCRDFDRREVESERRQVRGRTCDAPQVAPT